MLKMKVSILAAALTVAFASVSLPAQARTQAPQNTATVTVPTAAIEKVRYIHKRRIKHRRWRGVRHAS